MELLRSRNLEPRRVYVVEGSRDILGTLKISEFGTILTCTCQRFSKILASRSTELTNTRNWEPLAFSPKSFDEKC